MEPDVLLLADRVRNTIQLGESHFREFKSAFDGPPASKHPRPPRSICGDIGEALVAFANADGGELLIGVEDDGAVTGVSHSPDEVAAMLRAPSTHVHPDSPLPLQRSTSIAIDGKTVLYFAVAKGTSEIYQLVDGRCLRRSEKSSQPETIKRIQFERQERQSRECDRQFVDGAQVTDLDLQHVQDLANSLLRGIGPERYLQQVGLAEYTSSGLRLRYAALLLFAREIQRWHPRCQVRLLTVAGNALGAGEHYNVRSETVVQGNILDLLLRSWEALRFALVARTEFGADARFEQKYVYPEVACREALVNAIAHRDYTSHGGIDVFVFDDRLEIRSPGALLSTLRVTDLQQLKGAHESRNALLARTLRDQSFMRELGEGMRRMFQSMEENELQKPEIKSDSASFSVVLPNRSVFGERQEQWLSVFRGYPLTTLQRRIIVCGMEGREISQDDIFRAIKTRDRDVYDREVTGLRKSQILTEIRTNAAAKTLAVARGVKGSEVGRFSVHVPSSTRLSETVFAVFVGNLPGNASEDELRRVFQSVGRVKQIDLPERGRQLYRFGFVHYFDREAVSRAIAELDGTHIGDRAISVRPFIPKVL